ncbi:MAG TPA: MerR family transcriptional regulator [Actinomycetota bacterium]|nr:MerR family transcriptional regulator [Actinomycetota bacterium]
MEEPRWTLDELAERVDAALAVDYHGQSSGRVRAVPDRRAIRWYTTIGLIDRPVAHRGRTALYGPRHLLQLVAVKRLQAKGLPLVAIQQELAGATDTQLARVARLSAATAPAPLAAADGGARSPRVPARPAARRMAAGPARRAAFWREQPTAATAADALSADSASAPLTSGSAPAGVRSDRAAGGGIASLRGIRLGDGATLLLEPGRDLDGADLQAILDAAGPLVAVLGARRLLGEPQAPTTPAAPGTAGDPAGGGGTDHRREHP